jgi:diguanylate cyclase (GGDEF)-like protein
MTEKSNGRAGAGKKQPRQVVNAATGTLRLRKQQAEMVRPEAARLQGNLADVQTLTLGQSTVLQEANEQLVLAALHAETIAEEAVSHLDQLARSSQHDALTDTPNRALMLDRLENAIALARRHRTRIAVLFLDLDEFKQINDTLGHAVGDAVVQLVARRLESVVRHSDTVSRHGGDEFLVLMAEISQPSDAALIAEKILAALAAPSRIDNHLISLSASLGIALFPEDGDDAATLITRADAAMYSCKKQGGGNFQFFSEASFRARSLPRPPAEARDERSTTAQNSATRTLRDANEQLVLAALTAEEREKQTAQKHERQVKCMAIVADELRNPTMPIRAAAGLLKSVRSKGLLEEVQALIERQVAHMSRLVEDLLDGARVTTGKLRVRMSTVDIDDVLGSAVAACHPAMAARHQRLTMRFPPSPLYIQGDAVRLAQIFCNLLDNATKYTPDGGEITLVGKASGDAVVITVSDNGIGISQARLARIFDLFGQDERALALGSGGLGIGLGVARDLVEAHGGTIVAHSTGKNLGSEFIVTLPIRRESQAASSAMRRS